MCEGLGVSGAATKVTRGVGGAVIDGTVSGGAVGTVGAAAVELAAALSGGVADAAAMLVKAGSIRGANRRMEGVWIIFLMRDVMAVRTRFGDCGTDGGVTSSIPLLVSSS